MIEINGQKINPQEFIDKWEKWALTPTGRSHKIISENIQWLYEQANLTPVPVVVCDTLAHFSDELNSVRDSVMASVRDSVGAYYWADDLAFDDVFLKTKVITDKKLTQKIVKYIDVLSDCSFEFLTDKKAIVLIKPKILRDPNKRLHCEEDLAVKWAEDDGFHYLHGVRFDKELWSKVVKQELSFQEAMAIVDIDQRWVAIKFLGEKILQGTDNELLNKSERGNELYLVRNLFPSHPEAYYLRYICPSTGRVYFSGIDPEIGKKKNADEAMSWKFGLVPSEYQELKTEA